MSIIEKNTSLRMKIWSLPNAVTSVRIVLSVILLFITPLSSIFFIIYIICGLSDVLDGYIARRTKATTQIGAILDSIADFVFIGVLLVIYVPLIEIPLGILTWIVVIAFVRLMSLIVGFYKYHTFTFLHTYANKITGILLFCFPLLYSNLGIIITACIICFAASFSAVEEFSINITSKKLERDIKCYLNR